MISAFFISLGAFLFSVFGSVLPASEGLPASVSSALEFVGTSVNGISYLIPVGALFGALAMVIGYEAVIWIFHGILWVWKKIPIIGR